MPDSDEMRAEEGQRLELRCRARRGSPTPRLVWSRNGAVLADGSDRVRITSSRYINSCIVMGASVSLCVCLSVSILYYTINGINTFR